MKDNDPQTDIRRASLNYLARRDYSRHELVQKLKAKGYCLSDIDVVLTKLVAAGLINEDRFAENYIHWRRNKGFGPERIAMELQARGISDEMIAERLQITDNSWLDTVRRVWQKHFKGIVPNDFQTKAKQIRFLQYRGFTREQIEAVLSGDQV